MNDTDNIRVPDGLSARLEEKLLAAALAERDLDSLIPDGGRRPQRPRRPRRWLWGAVPAVALASLAIALLINRPKPLPEETFQELTAAYDELERSFGSFSEAINHGRSFFEKPYEIR